MMDTSSFVPSFSNSVVNLANSSDTKELLAGWPNSTVAILFSIWVYKLPLVLSVVIKIDYQMSLSTKLRVLHQGSELSPKFPDQGEAANHHPDHKGNPDGMYAETSI